MWRGTLQLTAYYRGLNFFIRKGERKRALHLGNLELMGQDLCPPLLLFLKNFLGARKRVYDKLSLGYSYVQKSKQFKL